MARTKKKLAGQRPFGKRWQAYMRINGRFCQELFDQPLTSEAMTDWRRAQRQKVGGGRVLAADSFAADVQTYLLRRAAMASIGQVGYYLAIWVTVLGRDRTRHSITSTEIDIILQAWLKDGVHPEVVVKRRLVLLSFFRVMNAGTPHAKVNPAREAARPKLAKRGEAKSIDYGLIEPAIAAMRTTKRHRKGTVPEPSLHPVRARVIAYTGIPGGMLAQVLPADLSLNAPHAHGKGRGTVTVRARRKGGGVESRTLPLTPDGREAFRLFHEANAYGWFKGEALNLAFKEGCGRIGLDPKTVNLYRLRHSFLTEVYRVTRDLATVGRLGIHVEGSPTTAQYARGANQDVDAAAVAAFSAALSTRRQQAITSAVRPRQAASQAAQAGIRKAGSKLRRIA
jgi:hypothetical protein